MRDRYEDWLKILNVFDEQKGYLRQVFRWYSLEGTSGMNDVDSMGEQQWLNFCKCIKVVHPK
eukprot:SAG31_NODE_15428_length_756_cov_0.677321_1_plen_61_part_10